MRLFIVSLKFWDGNVITLIQDDCGLIMFENNCNY